ncbi:MAG: hypothetical protein HYX75_03780 [Acidobacteria bacterium]|nr:hypothetical protein [Acidobacteriota bacterium]
MAVRVLPALVRAHYQSAWNRVRRESGLGGVVATTVSLGIAALVLLIPGVMSFGAGLSIGRDLSVAGDPGSLLSWNLLQALFTTAFGILGSARYKPSLTARAIGAYPIRPTDLLLAEFPASAVEVFPLLGIAGIVFSNAGLAIALPQASPAILILAIQGMIVMLALQILAGGLKRFLARHWSVAPIAGLTCVFVVSSAGKDRTVRVIEIIIANLPGSLGYGGLIDLWLGRPVHGLATIGLSFLAAAALIVIAGRVHYRALFAEEVSSRLRLIQGAPVRFGSPAMAIGRLFLKQLLGTNSGRQQLFLPLSFSVSYAFVLWAVRKLIEENETLPELIASHAESLFRLPFLGLFLFLLVPLNSEVWMNQFGWDRAGIRMLLSSPITHRDLVLGKMFGLLRLTLTQAAIGVVPIIATRRPSLEEALWGFGAFGTAFMVTTGVGHVVSARFPRAVERKGSANLPLSLSWIPTVIVGTLVAGLIFVGKIADSRIAYLVILGVSILVYIRCLPIIAARVDHSQERLLQM